MSTTKFMTATGSNRELHIKRSNEDHVQIRQFDPEFLTHQAKTFFLNPSEAPALALAILESAGYDDMTDDANLADVHAFNAMHKLQESVDTHERATAEAKAQAELEAEALELLNVVRDARGIKPHLTVAEASPEAMNEWLSVARKAREMRAEK